MAWTNPTTQSTGTLITATIWNTDIVDNLTALRSGSLAITSQGANEIIYASSSSQLARSSSFTFDGSTLSAPAATFTGTIAWGGGSAISSSNDVALLNATNTFTNTNQFTRIGVNVAPSGSYLLYVNGDVAADWAARVNNTRTTAGQSFGMLVNGGTNSSDMAFAVRDATNANDYFVVRGDGYVSWGGGSAISSSSNVALLSAANVFTNNNTFSEDVRIYRSAGTTTGYINFGASGSNYFGYSGSGFVANGSLLVGSLLTVSGAGTNTFDATTTGTQAVRVRNLSNGSAARSSFYVGNDGSATRFTLDVYSSTFSAGAPQYADGVALVASGSGGLNINASHASGDVRIYSRGTLAATWGLNQGATFVGDLQIDSATSGGALLTIGPSSPSANGTGRLRFINSATNVNWQISHNDSAGATFEITPSTAGGGSTFTTPVFKLTTTTARFTGDLIVDNFKKLYLDGGSDTYISETGANTIDFYAGGSLFLRLQSGGSNYFESPVIYNTTTGSGANVHVASNGVVSRSTSSIRYKHDIAPLDTAEAYAAVMAMRPITYRGKTDEDQRRHVGFVAEEMAEIAPLLATYDEGGESGTPNYVTYDRVTAYLVAVVQQQQAEIDALKAQKEQK